MDWPPDPKSWLEYPAECLWYLIPGLLYHAAILLASPLLIAIVRVLTRYRPRSSTTLIFQGYLLLAAMIVNGVWSCAVWGHLYWSVDYTADFSVFLPITTNQIEYSWEQIAGGLNGITLTQLNVIWAIFAASAWLLSFVATWLTIRIKPSFNPNQTPPCSRKTCPSTS